ncbi:CoA transferase, partial [Marinicauda pacifica]
DGWFVVVMLSEKEFGGWGEAVEALDLLEDERCADMASRFLNWDTIRERCEPNVASLSVETVLARLREKRVPAGKVNTSEDMLTHPQLLNSGFLYEADGGKAG